MIEGGAPGTLLQGVRRPQGGKPFGRHFAQNTQGQAAAGEGLAGKQIGGDHQIRSLTIAPEAVDPDDVEMLQDLILAAVNEAMRNADKYAEEQMSKVTGGLSLGGLF